MEQNLRQNIKNKDEYIAELEKKVTLIEKQLQERYLELLISIIPHIDNIRVLIICNHFYLLQ